MNDGRRSVSRIVTIVAATVAVGGSAAIFVIDRLPADSWRSSSVPRGVYVVSSTTGDVVRIDPETQRVAETIELQASHISSIAIAGEFLYYTSYGGSTSYGTVGRYGLSTGENEPTFIDQQFYAPILRASPSQPEVLFVGESGLSPANIQKWSVPDGAEDPSLLARTEHGPMGGSLNDFQISADGSRIWSACGAPYEFLELNTSDLRLSGTRFPAEPYPTSVDSVTADGVEYLLGGTDSTYGRSIHFYQADDPGSEVHYAGIEDAHEVMRTSTEHGAVALSSDASTIYRVVTNNQDESASVETLSATSGQVLATTPVTLSDYFVEGISADPVTGNVFVSVDNAIAVLDADGNLLQAIPGVPGAGQVLITAGPAGPTT